LDRQNARRHHCPNRAQNSIKKLIKDALPEYRRLAAYLIDRCIDDFEAQGGRRIEITEKFERMYKWKQ